MTGLSRHPFHRLQARDAQAGQRGRAEGDQAVGYAPGKDVVGVYDGLADVGGGGVK
jgi:hypothetical protein